MFIHQTWKYKQLEMQLHGALCRFVCVRVSNAGAGGPPQGHPLSRLIWMTSPPTSAPGM